MELYALIGIALIAVTLIHKKLTARPCEPVVEAGFRPYDDKRRSRCEASSLCGQPVREVAPTPMDIDEDIMTCTPLQPPSPMSTSETSSSDFVIDPDYIKK